MSQRKYEPEFKKETVRLIVDKGRSAGSVAKDLGISPDTVYGWVKQFKEEQVKRKRGRPAQDAAPQFETFYHVEAKLGTVNEQEVSRLKEIASIRPFQCKLFFPSSGVCGNLLQI